MRTTKKQGLGWLLISIACTFAPCLASADETDEKPSPWERYNVNLGVFFATINSNVRLGTTSAGVDFDVEDTLGLDSGHTAFRLDAAWRFTENRRHRLDFNWFSINRDGSTTLGRDLELDGQTFPTGTTVSSSFDLDLYKLSYSYSFLQDDRVDLAIAAGFYVAPISISVNATGGFSGTANASITAPLPVVGIRADFLLAPKWYLRTGFDIFYVEIDNYTGYLTDVRIAAEYQAFKHVGFGLGFDMFNLQVEAEESTSIPGVDFDGKIGFDYAGVYLYTKVNFD